MSGSPHSDRTPIRLTRRGRAVVIGFAATVTLILLWLTVGPGAFAGDRGNRDTPPARTVVVEPGETLWDIASAADPETDPRLVVERIIDLNGLADDPTVQPGQELRLPS